MMLLPAQQFTDVFNMLRENGRDEEADQLVLYQMEWDLVDRIGPQFMHVSMCIVQSATVDDAASAGPVQVVFPFCDALETYRAEVERYLSILADRRKGLRLVRASFLCLETDQWLSTVRSVFELSFPAFCTPKTVGSPDGPSSCPKCLQPKNCNCHVITLKFRQICWNLHELDLLEVLLPGSIWDCARSQIQEHIRTTCQSLYEMAHLQLLLWWFKDTIARWIQTMRDPTASELAERQVEEQLQPQRREEEEAEAEPTATFELLNEKKEQLLQFLYESYGKFLIDEMFSIIIDYPDSAPVVDDLKLCIEYSQLRGYFTEELRNCIQRRLLHPGVNTCDIITAYIQTVKALRHIDPSGVLMENVCEPIREYLRHRHDTVRCIVTVLTDVKNPEIASELMQPQPAYSTSFEDTDWLTDLETPEKWQEWKPDPIDAKPDSKPKSRRTADFISMLVNVYGSRELFVKEHSQLLAERLLHATDSDIENELRYLELLKLRFGENDLRCCEVMLKDVKDSCRINSLVSRTIQEGGSREEPPVDISSLIISSQFWPKVKEDRLVLPVPVEQSMQHFCREYEKLKGSRTLEWYRSAGLVDIELQMDGKMAHFSVSPMLASIIYLFQEKEVWCLDELANRLKVSSVCLKNRITWWSCAGVLHESQKNVWSLVNSLPSSEERRISSLFDEEEEDLMTEPEVLNRATNLEVFWPYISSLLKNVGSLTAERIHKLLKMCSDDGRDRTSLEHVTAFLRSKVKEQLLVQVDGAYRIPSH